MSFQFAIDNAESISIDTRAVVAATQSRSGHVRSISRGGSVWTFSVRLPDGPSWSEYRGDIARLEQLGRVSTAPIQFNLPGHDWIVPYQGNAANPAAITATVPATGNTITLTAGQAATGFNFRAGDVLQLGAAGQVYRVAADVPAGTNTVTLHRPLIDPAGSVLLRTGPDVVWTVRCVTQPLWTWFSRNQISWSGPFVFVEVL